MHLFTCRMSLTIKMSVCLSVCLSVVGIEAYDYFKELAKGSRDSEGQKNIADFLMR